jgi:hypothetical protein
MTQLFSSLATYSADSYYNNPIAAGVANTIAVTAPIMEVMPFRAVDGKAITVNYQTQDDNQTEYVADSGSVTDVSGQAQLAVSTDTFEIKSLVGQAQVATLSTAAASSQGVDLMATAVEAKAREIGRKMHKNMVATVSGGFSGLNSKVTPTDKTGSGNTDILALMDELMDGVTAKDGAVDFIMMNSALMNEFRAKARSLNAFEFFTLPVSNRNIMSYNGVPIFRNDHIPTANTDQSEIYAGTLDDGSNNGISMIFPAAVGNAGLVIEDLGVSERYLANITRITHHAGLAIFNTNGIKSITVDASVLV